MLSGAALFAALFAAQTPSGTSRSLHGERARQQTRDHDFVNGQRPPLSYLGRRGGPRPGGHRDFARGPRQRLTAEMVRDQGLAASGLLSSKMGGPPVYPPQPEGIWNSVYSGQKWKTSSGEDRFRRAI